MDEQLDYGDEDYGGSQKIQYQGGGAIPALADEEMVGEEDDYEDLYSGVNVGEGIFQLNRAQVPGLSTTAGNGGLRAQSSNAAEPRREVDASQGQYKNVGASFSEQKGGFLAAKGSEIGAVSQSVGGSQEAPGGKMGFQGPTSVPQRSGFGNPDTNKVTTPGTAMDMSKNRMVNATSNMNRVVVDDSLMGPSMENGPTMLFVGELHWWTTDAELESVLSLYGKVKEIKFFDERASGKSKGYCQVEFYDSAAAAACKEGMNGHVFNRRACVVTFASAQTLKQMNTSFENKTQTQPQFQPQERRNMNEGGGRGGGLNYQAGDGGRNYGRGRWGRGQGGPNRGSGFGGPRGRGPMGPRSYTGNAAGMVSGPATGSYGQGLAGPAFGGPGGGMMPPQAMMGHGFDPSFMGRGAGYGGFSGPAFPGMMPSFPAVNPMGLAGVAPHVNPAFFARGMAPNGMGMMGNNGMDGHPGGMWADPSMVGGWGGEDHGQRTGESSYGGDDGGSDYGYGEKGARSSATVREKERAPERERHSNSERAQEWDRSDRERRYREEKDGYRDHRQKDRDLNYEDDWDRGQSSSRSRSRSRAMPEDDYRSRARDMDYGKRRRVPSE